MKTALIVALMLVMAVQIAVASNVGDDLGNIAKAWAVDAAGRAAANAMNRREEVKPVPVGELGTIRLEPGAGCDRWAMALMGKACMAVGLTPVSVEDRQIVAEEAAIGGAPGVMPAEYIGTMTLERGNGRWTDAEVHSEDSDVRIDTNTVWAHITFKVTQNAVEVADVDVQAPDSATSFDASFGWFDGVEFRSHELTRWNLAVANACQRAANGIAARLAQRAAWRFDPQTGGQLAREGTCFACGRLVPAGANFCPSCGQDLHAPPPSQPEDPHAVRPQL